MAVCSLLFQQGGDYFSTEGTKIPRRGLNLKRFTHHHPVTGEPKLIVYAFCASMSY
jgi:hypothetical protein